VEQRFWPPRVAQLPSAPQSYAVADVTQQASPPSPHRTQPTPGWQLAPVPHTFPAQHAWSAAPQAAHLLSVPQISEALPQVLPAQQG
jgi:hypothetical protein